MHFIIILLIIFTIFIALFFFFELINFSFIVRWVEATKFCLNLEILLIVIKVINNNWIFNKKEILLISSLDFIYF